MGSDTLAAPHVLPVEVAKVLRRMTQSNEIDDSQAFTAHQTLLSLSIALFPYSQTGQRVWQLRHTVTVQDACFVALAEGLDSDLVTFDLPLSRAPGPRCRFLTPPAV